jgi:hypothetical protein
MKCVFIQILCCSGGPNFSGTKLFGSAASGVKQKSTQLFAPDWFLKGSIDGDLLSKLLAHQFLLFSGQHQPESATAS